MFVEVRHFHCSWRTAYYKREVNEADCELWFEASKLLLQYGARLDEQLKIRDIPITLPESKTVRDRMYLLFSKEEMDELERVAQTQAMMGWSFRSLLPRRFQ